MGLWGHEMEKLGFMGLLGLENWKKWGITGLWDRGRKNGKLWDQKCIVTIISCCCFLPPIASFQPQPASSWSSPGWVQPGFQRWLFAMVENDIHVPNGGYSPHLENSISGNIKILVTDYSCRKIFYVCYNIPVDPPIFGTCRMSKVTMLLDIKYLTLVHLYPGLSKVTMLLKSNS